MCINSIQLFNTRQNDNDYHYNEKKNHNQAEISDIEVRTMLKTAEELKEKLVPVMLDLLGNTAKKRQLQDQILKLGTTNADDLIAREILRSIA